eukprot:TRINITY_DN1586_c0_g1_i2.p1 TRINITY_DN1586_c0_g1~~TRINITY_DN1586_c0_g1_i2.p1  ORF type:complete len:1538 (-),score=401.27 TRINITY_DN1586_c0_g1_i2:189-4448(-)
MSIPATGLPSTAESGEPLRLHYNATASQDPIRASFNPIQPTPSQDSASLPLISQTPSQPAHRMQPSAPAVLSQTRIPSSIADEVDIPATVPPTISQDPHDFHFVPPASDRPTRDMLAGRMYHSANFSYFIPPNLDNAPSGMTTTHTAAATAVTAAATVSSALDATPTPSLNVNDVEADAAAASSPLNRSASTESTMSMASAPLVSPSTSVLQQPQPQVVAPPIPALQITPPPRTSNRPPSPAAVTLGVVPSVDATITPPSDAAVQSIPIPPRLASPDEEDKETPLPSVAAVRANRVAELLGTLAANPVTPIVAAPPVPVAPTALRKSILKPRKMELLPEEQPKAAFVSRKRPKTTKVRFQFPVIRTTYERESSEEPEATDTEEHTEQDAENVDSQSSADTVMADGDDEDVDANAGAGTGTGDEQFCSPSLERTSSSGHGLQLLADHDDVVTVSPVPPAAAAAVTTTAPVSVNVAPAVVPAALSSTAAVDDLSQVPDSQSEDEDPPSRAVRVASPISPLNRKRRSSAVFTAPPMAPNVGHELLAPERVDVQVQPGLLTATRVAVNEMLSTPQSLLPTLSTLPTMPSPATSVGVSSPANASAVPSPTSRALISPAASVTTPAVLSATASAVPSPRKISSIAQAAVSPTAAPPPPPRATSQQSSAGSPRRRAPTPPPQRTTTNTPPLLANATITYSARRGGARKRYTELDESDDYQDDDRDASPMDVDAAAAAASVVGTPDLSIVRAAPVSARLRNKRQSGSMSTASTVAMSDSDSDEESDASAPKRTRTGGKRRGSDTIESDKSSERSSRSRPARGKRVSISPKSPASSTRSNSGSVSAVSAATRSNGTSTTLSAVPTTPGASLDSVLWRGFRNHIVLEPTRKPFGQEIPMLMEKKLKNAPVFPLYCLDSFPRELEFEFRQWKQQVRWAGVRFPYPEQPLQCENFDDIFEQFMNPPPPPAVSAVPSSTGSTGVAKLQDAIAAAADVATRSRPEKSLMQQSPNRSPPKRGAAKIATAAKDTSPIPSPNTSGSALNDSHVSESDQEEQQRVVTRKRAKIMGPPPSLPPSSVMSGGSTRTFAPATTAAAAEADNDVNDAASPPTPPAVVRATAQLPFAGLHREQFTQQSMPVPVFLLPSREARGRSPSVAIPSTPADMANADTSPRRRAASVAKIFNGYSFVLTQLPEGSPVHSAEHLLRATHKIDQDVPVTRQEIVALVQARGGQIVQQYPLVPASPSKRSPGGQKTIVIADVPRRTLKYLFSLALGTPALHPQWIVACCRNNSIVPMTEHLLPAGLSLKADGADVPRSVPREKVSDVPLPMHERVLHEVSVYLAGDGERKGAEMREDWESLVKSSGATIAKDLKTADVLLSVGVLPKTVISKAKELNVPLLSTEWLVQCLIHQRRLRTTQHWQFSYESRSQP